MDSEKTKSELIAELEEARRRIAKLTAEVSSSACDISSQTQKVLLQHSPVCHKIVDTNLNLQFMNDCGFKMLQLTKSADVYGKPYPFDFFPKESSRRLKEKLKEVIQFPQQTEMDGVYCDSMGNQVWLHHVIVPVQKERGGLAYLAVVSSDITQQKRAEKELKKSLVRLNEAQRLGGIADWEYDVAHQKVSWSENLFRIFDLDPTQEAPEYPDQLKLYHPESAKLLRAAVERAINNGEHYELELKRIRADGTEVHFEVHGVSDTDEKGNVTRLYGTVLDITKRKQTEEVLRKNKADLDRALKIGRMGSYVWDLKTNEVLWSEQLHHNLLVEGEALSAEFFFSMIHPEDRERVLAEANHARKGGESITLEYRVVRPDGSVIHVLDQAEFEMDSKGTPLRLYGISQDITRMKRVEAELKASEARFRAIYNAIPLYLALWQQQGDDFILADVNPAIVEFTKGQIKKFIGSPLSKFYIDTPELIKVINQCHYSQKIIPLEMDYKLRTSDESLQMSMTFVAVPPDLVMMLAEDVTDRRKAQEAMQHYIERFTMAADSAGIGVWELDLFTNAILWDDWMFRLYGMDKEEFTGTFDTWKKALHPDDLEEAVKKVQSAIKMRSEFDTQFRIIWPDGEVRHIKANAKVICDDDGAPYNMIGVNYDITDRINAKEALIISKENAEAASRTKSEFLANMSHEIRTPMNGILGMLQLLQTTNINEEQKEYILTAIQSSKRLTRLLSDILDLSRVEANRLSIQSSPLNLAEVVDQTCEMFKPTAQQTNIELHCHVDPTIPSTLNGDAARLQQVLTNIIGNAFKFTKEGCISIEAYSLATADQNLYRVLFSITDTGIGIPDEKIVLLFQPFSQISEGYRRDYQGAGLGLSICKKLIELMGGHIAIESEPGEGTTVHFCVTFSVDEPVREQESSSTCPTSSASESLSILLAEDDFVNRLTSTKLLERQGHTVKAVENGKEAISQLRNFDFDVILMDIQMPEMDGVEATKAIRRGDAGEKNKFIPIIAMTAYAMERDREKFLAEGMNSYIAKPVAVDNLEEVIRATVFSKKESMKCQFQ